MPHPQRIEIRIGTHNAPVLDAFMADRHSFVKTIMGPLGSGKTIGCAENLLALATEQEPDRNGIRPTRFYAVRNTYPQLLETTVRDFRAVWEGLGHFKQGGMSRPNFMGIWNLPDGTQVNSEVVFIALDRLQDVDKAIRGLQATGFWFNEFKELPKSIVDACLGRVGRFPEVERVPATWSGAIGDMNAPDEDDWIYKAYVEDDDDDEILRSDDDEPAFEAGWTLYTQPGAVLDTGDKTSMGKTVWQINRECENYEHLLPGYYERQLSKKKEDWIWVNLANRYGFVQDGRPVQSGFFENMHVVDDIEYNDKWPLQIGMDFGRTPALVVMQHDPVMDRWLGLMEIVSEGMSAAIFGKAAKRKIHRAYPGAEWESWGDPAGDNAGQEIESSAIDIMNTHGFNMKAAPTNDWDMRVSAVDNPLLEHAIDGKPRLVISRSMNRLRKGLGGRYMYKKVAIPGEERFHEKPDKNAWSHVCEALQYVLLGGGEGKVIAKKPRRRRGPGVQHYESTYGA